MAEVVPPWRHRRQCWPKFNIEFPRGASKHAHFRSTTVCWSPPVPTAHKPLPAEIHALWTHLLVESNWHAIAVRITAMLYYLGCRIYSTYRPGREVDHSPPTIAEVKKSGSIHPLPHTPSWRSAYLVKHRDNFTYFTFTESYFTSKSLIRMYLFNALKAMKIN
jgi:hypothetical protein